MSPNAFPSVRKPYSSRVSTRVLLGALVWLLVDFSDVAARQVGVVPVGDQTLYVDRGRQHAISQGDVSIAVYLESINSRRAWLGISVFNASDRAVTVMDTGIRAAAVGSALQIRLADDLMKSKRRRQAWQKVAAGVAVGVDAYASGLNSEQGRFSGTIRSSEGTAHFSGTYTDPEASRRARDESIQRAQRLIDRVERTQSERMASLSQEVFRSQTVAPGDFHAGRVQIELPRKQRGGGGQQIDITVQAGGELHRFVAYVDRIPSIVPRATRDSGALRERGAAAPLTRSATLPVEDGPGPATPHAQSEGMIAKAEPNHAPWASPVPRLIDISVASMVEEDGTEADYVFFDIEWTLPSNHSTAPEAVHGRLVLLDEFGRERVVMPWSLSAMDMRRLQLVEHGVGFRLSDFGNAADWMRQAKLGEVTVAFEH
jgi:hypothetical protein